ncbi:hypothetical protein GCM10010344_16370 [Streptomyces bluensis]|nr:hypothetical protein GCM10010344_16370 [Streptomyces bluensis]
MCGDGSNRFYKSQEAWVPQLRAELVQIKPSEPAGARWWLHDPCGGGHAVSTLPTELERVLVLRGGSGRDAPRRAGNRAEEPPWPRNP